MFLNIDLIYEINFSLNFDFKLKIQASKIPFCAISSLLATVLVLPKVCLKPEEML